MSFSRLFLIDAHALCYRSFFAIRELRNSKGQATNAVYGFTAALKKILREHQPQYLAVCFDMKGKTRRQEKFAEYKIQRPSMPDDLKSQIPIIKDVVAAYNLPIIEMEGYEADDIIATLARRITKADLETVIVSDDKDMFQLVGKRVKILSTRQETIMGEAEVKELLGFSPDLIPDYLALAGDAVDNIPGVKGIGEVSAKNLLTEYGDLSKILKHVGEIKPDRVRKVLEAQKENAILSKELALLEENVPIDLNLETMRVGPPDQEKLRQLFSDLEFRKFVTELSPAASESEKGAPAKRTKSAGDLKALGQAITKNKSFSFWCEPRPQAGEIAPPQNILIHCGQEDVFQVSLNEDAWLKELFEKKEVLKVTHDVKDQLKRLGEYAQYLQGKAGSVFDLMLAGYLAAPSRGNYDMASLAWEFLKKSVPEEVDEVEKVRLMTELHDPLAKELKDRDLLKLLDELEVPLAFVLFGMEREGVCLDEKLLEDLSHDVTKKIDALVKDIYKLAGEEFNINSPKQLGEILFQKLKLPAIKKTKTGFSTDEGVLVKLSEKHALPAKLLEYRQLAKLKSTYIDALPKLIDSHTGRVHTTFNQAGTETGRLSSTNPNLQNIPIRTEMGRQIRAAFIPSAKDRVIVSADYSQIELRVLAHMAGDKNLAEAFKKGEDIHAYTAAQIFDVKENEVDAGMRDTAKRVNFGIAYGMSAFGLSKDLGISPAEAQDFIDRYFARYPGVKKFMDDEIAKCRKDGFVTTILHRRRYIPEIHSPNVNVRQFAERQAINTPVQGSAADMIKLAMIKVAEELHKKNFASRMIITVHDELVFDAVVSEEKALAELIRDCMENTMKLSVPIVVSLKHGKNWLKTEKM